MGWWGGGVVRSAGVERAFRAVRQDLFVERFWVGRDSRWGGGGCAEDPLPGGRSERRGVSGESGSSGREAAWEAWGRSAWGGDRELKNLASTRCSRRLLRNPKVGARKALTPTLPPRGIKRRAFRAGLLDPWVGGWDSSHPHPSPIPQGDLCITQGWLRGRPLTDFGRRRPNPSASSGQVLPLPLERGRTAAPRRD